MDNYGWPFDDKFKTHKELGKIFVRVTTSGIEVHVADATASEQIISSRRAFIKPVELLGMYLESCIALTAPEVVANPPQSLSIFLGKMLHR
jgi:hypothetical protein